MTKALERYFSFRGRLARLPFFIRCIYVNIAAMLPLVLGLALFTHDGRAWWWAALAAVLLSLVVLGVGLASTFARRLHDLGLFRLSRDLDRRRRSAVDLFDHRAVQGDLAGAAAVRDRPVADVLARQCRGQSLWGSAGVSLWALAPLFGVYTLLVIRKS
jgi:hypothetical protein